MNDINEEQEKKDIVKIFDEIDDALSIKMNDINEKQEKKDIVKIFDEIDDALSLEDIVSELKESEHSDPGKVVLRAIQDKILYVEDIEDDETIYLALTRPGEKLWKSLCTTET